MPRRPLHWLVLGFATLWFGVLVPVHNRGEIAVAGSGDSACSDDAPPCHATKRPCHGGLPDSTPRPARACAVCYFIAALDGPPPVSVVQTRLGLSGQLRPQAPQAVRAVRVTLPYHSRAPPRRA